MGICLCRLTSVQNSHFDGSSSISLNKNRGERGNRLCSWRYYSREGKVAFAEPPRRAAKPRKITVYPKTEPGLLNAVNFYLCVPPHSPRGIAARIHSSAAKTLPRARTMPGEHTIPSTTHARGKRVAAYRLIIGSLAY